MPASDPLLCRASVHSGTTVVDLALPTAVPVAVLIPSIVDIVKVHEPGQEVAAGRYHLSLPGASALNPSLTLTQNGIDDGAVLVLSLSATPPPAPRYDDAAEAVAATLATTTRPWGHTEPRHVVRITGAAAAGCLTGIGAAVLIWNTCHGTARGAGTTAAVAALTGLLALMSAVTAWRGYREPLAGLTLTVIATAFAAVSGFVAVPGTPGFPHVLLAATAAAVTSVLAMRLSDCGISTLTAVPCVATVVAVAALAGVCTTGPPRAVFSVAALLSLGALGLAPRISIVVSGLSPRLPPGPGTDETDSNGTLWAARALRADRWLGSLRAAFSWSAAIGAVVTVLAGAHRLCCVTFAAGTGALLLLHARGIDGRRMRATVVSGIAVFAITLGVAALRAPERGPWIAATTGVLAAAAMYLAFAAPAVTLSPLARRGIEALEYLMLVAMVPLACWICGLYGTIRDAHLR